MHFIATSIRKIGKRATIGLLLLAATGAAMLLGAYSPAQASVLLARMWPVLLFALAMGIVAGLARQAHFFHVSAHYVHVLSRGNFLALFLIFCALTIACTVFLSIDTAAVMLTPAAIALAASAGKGTRPLAYAVIWLANMSSLLLPVSNLTNLLAMQRASALFSARDAGARLAFRASPAPTVISAAPAASVTSSAAAPSPLAFAQLTWLPWLVCTMMPIIALLILEREEFAAPGRSRPKLDPAQAPQLPELIRPGAQPANPEIRDRGLLIRAALIVAALCIALAAGVTPWLAACLGAALLALSALATPGVSLPRGLIPFKMMTLVVGLFFATDCVSTLLAGTLAHLASASPFAVAFAGLAGANIADNLPAYLALEPAVTSIGAVSAAGTVSAAGAAPSLLALLIGVNAGPIITPWASLATLLWYEQLLAEGEGVNWWRFLRRGVVLAPLTVTLAVGSMLLFA